MTSLASLRNSSKHWTSFNQILTSLRAPAALANCASVYRLEQSPQTTNKSDCNLDKKFSITQFPLPGNMATMLPSTTTLNSSCVPNAFSETEMVQTENSKLKKQEMPTEVEITAVDCPLSVRSDIERLFPSQSILWPLTVLTIAQHTKNDMTAWTAEVAEERDVLTEQLVSTATEICHALQAEGYFADFIDPSSGRPFLSQEFTPATLFETDSIQRHFGVQVKDLGCCKAVYHALWGSKVFIGTLLTNAPKDSPLLSKII